MAHNEKHLLASFSSDVGLETVEDGTTTRSAVVDRGARAFGLGGASQWGYGVAKRRKGDRNYPRYGRMLAMARALEDAAQRLRQELATFDKQSHAEREQFWS